jgi:hypothetical protein
MPKFQIQTRFYEDQWECPEEFPTIYKSYQEAQDELDEFVKECQDSVSLGYLDDFNPRDWRIFEIAEATLENAIWFLADAFALLENHQETQAVRDAMTLMDQALQILEKNHVG